MRGRIEGSGHHRREAGWEEGERNEERKARKKGGHKRFEHGRMMDIEERGSQKVRREQRREGDHRRERTIKERRVYKRRT